MGTVSKGKGGVGPVEWAKHLRKFWRRLHNRRVRADGKRQIKEVAQ